MIYLALIFMPPVYFIVRKQWGGFMLNALLYGLAWLCVLSMVGIMIAPVFWALAVGQAAFACRKEMLTHHAELIATKMAEKLKDKP
jgi:hypothetical protein